MVAHHFRTRRLVAPLAFTIALICGSAGSGGAGPSAEPPATGEVRRPSAAPPAGRSARPWPDRCRPRITERNSAQGGR